MVKNYVLDTNVLLTDPDAIFNFEDNIVVIPIGVIEELDTFKKHQGELGKNARSVSRSLDTLMQKGDLRKGVEIPNSEGGKVKVLYNGNLHQYNKKKNVDLHVIHIAEKLTSENSEERTVIVSRDTNVRIRAKALGLEAQDYESIIVDDGIPFGFSSIILSGKETKLFEKLEENLVIDVSDLPISEGLPENHYINLISETNRKRNILSKRSGDRIAVLPDFRQGIKIKPKNLEQTFVMSALLDEDIRLVSITGPAGTGKTILATAVGYYLTEKTKTYSKLLVSRPVMPLGRDIGFLPGNVGEKLDPWMQPIYDALERIMSKKNIDGRELVMESSFINIEPLTYIRGRSIHDQFVIIDEAQNLTPLELKTIITRAGGHTKIVLTGDITQIDNPYINEKSNGLSVITKSFVPSALSANVVMTKGVRSPLAQEATERL